MHFSEDWFTNDVSRKLVAVHVLRLVGVGRPCSLALSTCKDHTSHRVSHIWLSCRLRAAASTGMSQFILGADHIHSLGYPELYWNGFFNKDDVKPANRNGKASLCLLIRDA